MNGKEAVLAIAGNDSLQWMSSLTLARVGINFGMRDSRFADEAEQE